MSASGLLITFMSFALMGNAACDTFCQICSCDINTIVCRRVDTISNISAFDVLSPNNINSMYIRNQGNLTQITKSSLIRYRELIELAIVDSGLESIDADAFEVTTKLKKVDLRNNKLATVSWRIFHRLLGPEVLLDSNPLLCVCANKWVQNAMEIDSTQNTVRGGEFWPTISSSSTLACRDEHDRSHLLIEYEFNQCRAAIQPFRLLFDINCFYSSTFCPLYSTKKYAINKRLICGLFNPIEAPRIHIDKKEIQLYENEHFSVKCSADGVPTPTVGWDLNHLVSEVEIEGEMNIQRIKVNKTMMEDTTNITCTAQNIVGPVSQHFSLFVRSAPKITKLETRQQFNWCIYYEFKGYPTPNKTWMFNGDLLVPSSNVFDSAINQYKGCLSFRTTSIDREGTYTLIVSNEYGSINDSLKLRFHYQTVELRRFPSFQPPYYFLPGDSKINQWNKWSILQSIGVWATVIIGLVFVALLLICMNKKHVRSNENYHTNILMKLLPILSRHHEATTNNFQRNVILSSAMENNPQYEIDSNESRAREDPEETFRVAINQTGTQYSVFPSSLLEHQKIIGEGAFGKVYLALLRLQDSCDSATAILVAVKVLKFSSQNSVLDFDREASLLASLDHENIVHFYGACIDESPWKMIFEFMENGDLNCFLRSRGPDTHMLKPTDDPTCIDVPSRHTVSNERIQTLNLPCRLTLMDLLNIAKCISSGMEYLANKRCIHRDLATRNCLVGENLNVKIGDFGMSRDIYSSDYYQVACHTLLPIRWMSPESIVYRKFTVESDVWSFGVVLWEIFSFGKQPWYEYNNQEVILQVTSSCSLPCPTDCPPEVYRLMLSCWITQQAHRITMKEVHHQLCQLCCSTPPSSSSC